MFFLEILGLAGVPTVLYQFRLALGPVRIGSVVDEKIGSPNIAATR